MAIRIISITCDSIEESIAILGTIGGRQIDMTSAGDVSHVTISLDGGGEAVKEPFGTPGDKVNAAPAALNGAPIDTASDKVSTNQGELTPSLQPALTPAQAAIAAATAAAQAAQAAAKKESAKKGKEKAKPEPAPAPAPAVIDAAPEAAPAPIPPTATAEPAPNASSSEEGSFFGSTDQDATAPAAAKTHTYEEVHEAMRLWSSQVGRSTFIALTDKCGVKRMADLEAKPEMWNMIMETVAASMAEIEAVKAAAAGA